MKFDEVKKIIEKIAPLEYGEDWDNTGIQIRNENDEIKRILVTMEINENVLEEAKEKKVDMILTHHPFVFSKINKIDYATVQGRYLIEAIKGGFSIYSAHLTFDNAPGGNNYYLGELLGLENIEEPRNNPNNIPGIMGKLKKGKTLKEVCNMISEKWQIPKEILKIAGNLEMEVSKIAICAGAGGDLLSVAVKEGCQVLITGDTKLHQAQKAIAEGVALIDAGHYETEKQFVENMSARLRKKIDGVDVLESQAKINPYIYIS